MNEEVDFLELLKFIRRKKLATTILLIISMIGCNGNTKGISKLVKGRKASEVADILRGTQCGMRGTSCPDQLAKALDEIITK